MSLIPEIILKYQKNSDGEWFLTAKGDPRDLARPQLLVRTSFEEENGQEDSLKESSFTSFPVFAQNAMTYGEYSDYINHHGCACCSLTSLLAAYCPDYRALRPDDTIRIVEAGHFPDEVWMANYSASCQRQMPVTLYGISRILESEGIKNRYIGAYRDRQAYSLMEKHLKSGRPVVIETSRVRKKRGIPVSIHDRRYAGSYHTMVLLGYDRTGKVVFADSATRDWAGSRQRLKRDRLSRLMQYMFPRINPSAANLYFDHRWNTGGFILIDG